MSKFAPNANGIVTALARNEFPQTHISYAEKKKVSLQLIAIIEFKLWYDFCEAVGENKIEDACITEGRKRYFDRVVDLLILDPNLSNYLRDFQLCATDAGLTAGRATPDDIDAGTFADSCDNVRNRVAVLQPVCGA